ncbi:MAG: nodulation protein NfeD [Nitrospirae bacterium]|nr:nodulation protein NfeD [Nitrospirota bacterium]
MKKVIKKRLYGKIGKAIFIFSALILPLLYQESSFGQENRVLSIKIASPINPVSAEFILNSIKQAGEEKYEAIVIELDTPGGLVDSMRNIVKGINQSNVPVIVYVSPSGARAASAGTFITMAAHVAAMAPGTNIGAAHPVTLHGDMSPTMAEKATNDLVAFIKSIAATRGRNEKWAEDAVRKSVSVTDKEALSLNVVDLIADNVQDLLKKADGRKVTINGKELQLHTKDARATESEMGARLKVLSVISDPNVAYILMLIGLFGIFFEISNPGSLFPGIIGGVSLILSFYAMNTLPVNYAGLLLIILAIILFILEIKIVSHGALALGGIISMIMGSLMLFEKTSPYAKLSIQLIVLAALTTAAFFLTIVGMAYRAWKRKPVTGVEGLAAMVGKARTDITSTDGTVFVHGELWRAQSEVPIEKGKEVVVISVDGLKLNVKAKSAEKT